MKFIDFHADTLYRLFYQENRELGDLWENSWSICGVAVIRPKCLPAF